MDTLDKYRQIIETILQEYTTIPYRYGDVKDELIISRNQCRYLVITMGWEAEKRVHGCLIHIDIIDHKIWIQRDGTEDGIANDLVAAGIPKEEIVLAFHPPEIRQYTGYAIA
ncbi:XisI protein [Floridanema aerugineum]|uniref:XisI protein n=1 Tax=Floridaenema aerugineum BLCC-F46 TaxID=3153654 RepID=A0ABV4WYE7_9CYAN